MHFTCTLGTREQPRLQGNITPGRFAVKSFKQMQQEELWFKGGGAGKVNSSNDLGPALMFTGVMGAPPLNRRGLVWVRVDATRSLSLRVKNEEWFEEDVNGSLADLRCLGSTKPPT